MIYFSGRGHLWLVHTLLLVATFGGILFESLEGKPIGIPLSPPRQQIDTKDPNVLNAVLAKWAPNIQQTELAKEKLLDLHAKGVSNIFQWYPNPPTPLNLVNFQNSAYYATISLGNPPQSFTVLPDTASSEFWVPSVFCTSNPGCTNYNQYNPALSTFYHPRGREFLARYHNGTVTGLVVQDLLQLSSYQLETQQFGMALTVNGTALDDRPYDGIMGFGFPELCSTGIPPFFNLIRTGQLELPIFSFWFGPETASPGGILYFSGVNTDLFVPDLVWISVISHRFWMVLLRNVQFGVTVYREGCQALFDTSTPFIIGPTDVIEAINLSMSGIQLANGLWRIPCQLVPTLPDFTVFLGKFRNDFSIPASAYIFEDGFGSCYSYFIGLNLTLGSPPLPTWVLGYSFLRVWYSAYDADLGRIGLAKALSF